MARRGSDRVGVDALPAAIWAAYSRTVFGALREDLTVPRSTPDSGPSTSLIAADAPLPASAVEADLEVLDPIVSAHVRTVVEQADPGLDQDLADWRSDDCARPRLALLGPVMVGLVKSFV